ncbi:MAG: SIS domain-containing protein [Clostridiaceae bacterium]|nr:SIS domain-containing protein [Clostridiaceae bacterium]
MKRKTVSQIKCELLECYPSLHACEEAISAAYSELLHCFQQGGKLLVAGNGGSCADSEHIAGELMKSFRFRRAPDPSLVQELIHTFGPEGRQLAEQLEGGLPVIPLGGMQAISTAYANDVSSCATFAQLVQVLGRTGDVFLGISTSGNSENIIMALMAAKARHLCTIVLTGGTGGRCAKECDVCICVPEEETFRIQELHLPIYHGLCAMLEAELFCEC